MNDASKELTCQDRVKSSLEGRLVDLRILFYGATLDDVELIDDGTLDTVIRIDDYDYRFSLEQVSAYRDEETGELDIEDFWQEIEGEINGVFLNVAVCVATIDRS